MPKIIRRRLIEGFWTCDKCDRTKIPARYDSCPGCGSRRNKTTKYEMLDKTNYVPDEIAQTIDRNPDWLCSHCNNLNRANVINCDSCGAPRTEEEKDYFENRKDIQEKEEYIQNLEEDFNNKHFGDGKLDRLKKSYKDKFNLKSFNPSKVVMTIAIIVLALALLIPFISLFIPKEETLEITNFSWESTISIEEYKTVKESDWYLPSGGRLLYTNEEISHYDKVFDHYETKTKTVSKEVFVGYEEDISYEDLGNGYFEEIVELVPVYETVYEEVEYQEAVYIDVPVYKTKYYYEIDKWVYKESVKETGKDKNPYYPDVSYASNEREKSRNQTYFVTGINEDKESFTLSISYDDWMNLKEGQIVKFKIYLGNSAEIIEIE